MKKFENFIKKEGVIKDEDGNVVFRDVEIGQREREDKGESSKGEKGSQVSSSGEDQVRRKTEDLDLKKEEKSSRRYGRFEDQRGRMLKHGIKTARKMKDNSRELE